MSDTRLERRQVEALECIASDLMFVRIALVSLIQALTATPELAESLKASREHLRAAIDAAGVIGTTPPAATGAATTPPGTAPGSTPEQT